jgi:hypothetical protein
MENSHDSVIEMDVHMVGYKMYFLKKNCALGPCIQGFWEGCRTYLSIDSTKLNGRWCSQLASVYGVDGHNWMYPIAFTDQATLARSNGGLRGPEDSETCSNIVHHREHHRDSSRQMPSWEHDPHGECPGLPKPERHEDPGEKGTGWTGLLISVEAEPKPAGEVCCIAYLVIGDNVSVCVCHTGSPAIPTFGVVDWQ